jgi:hypothetical protein
MAGHCFDHQPEQFLQCVLLIVDVDGYDLEVVGLPDYFKGGLLQDLNRCFHTYSL